MVANDMYPPGPPAECPICQQRIRVEPSAVGDAVCPKCGTLVWPPERAARLKIPDVDGYRLVARISADHYRAVSPDNSVVALRLLPSEFCRHEMWVRRWQREAELRSEIQHPNLINVLGHGSFRGNHYMVTEYVPGRTVDEMFEATGTLETDFASGIVRDCCHALVYLHQRNIVHRSMGPVCILIDNCQVARLTDFGLASSVGEELSMTQSGTGLGRPLYMSPEQARNAKRVDHRADIYALGAMFYHLVTGHLPFQGDTVMELIMARERGNVVPVQQHAPAISDSVAQVIHRMLEANPDDRPASCEEVVAELTA